MTVVMKDAIKPNLVQTLEGQPALVHAGPFGNIAHAANSIIADRIALKAADYVITEAGFASDLGFQKFCDIVCRVGGFAPSAAVLVTTVRATKSHGGKAFKDLAQEDLDAAAQGRRQPGGARATSCGSTGCPAWWRSTASRPTRRRRLALVRDLALKAGAETVVTHTGFSNGGDGAVDLANAVVTACDKPNTFQFLTPPGTPIAKQIEAIATKLYGAAGSTWSRRHARTWRRSRSSGSARRRCAWRRRTCRSRTTRTCATGRPASSLPVRGLVPSAGAGFVVALCGEMQRMPGLGKTPAFHNIDIDANGQYGGVVLSL